MEDLVGIYLQSEKNYIYMPSTNKIGTSVFEFMLINKEKDENGIHKKAVIQCKSGNENIDDKLFKDEYKDYFVYLFTVNGTIPPIEEKDKNRIIKIEKEVLFEWCKNNREILTGRVQKYLSKLM